MSDLKVMILCGRSPRHLYITNKISSASKPVAIIQEVGSHWTFKKVLNLLKSANLYKKIWRWIRDRKRYLGGKEAQFFFGNKEPSIDRPDLVHEVSHINHPDVIKLTEQYQPDIITVFGTSLIHGDLLNRGRLGIVNLHGGLSPHYRGADCTFWALHNQEPEKVGCTLHYIDPGIDSGKLIAHISPEILSDDDELTLFWRAVYDSGDVYAEFLNRVGNGEQFGQKQTEKGCLYQVKDRSLKHEKRLDRLIANGLLKNLNLTKRIIWFKENVSTKS